MLKIRASAPTRVDLAGGTLDIMPLHQILDFKATLNVAVSLNASVELWITDSGEFEVYSEDQSDRVKGSFSELCTVGKLPWICSFIKEMWHESLPTFKLHIKAKSPAGAGLGGSSSLGIALYGALHKARSIVEGKSEELCERKMVAFVQDLETNLIRVPTGCQDYWAAVRGGINILQFPVGSTNVTTLPTSALSPLNQELILCYSGKSRASANNNWAIFKAAFDGDYNALGILNEIGMTAETAIKSAFDSDWQHCYQASKEEWALRKRLWPDIVTDQTTALEEAAAEAGAGLCRCCGAGGGGVMAIFCNFSRREQVCDALIKKGGFILEGNVTDEGLVVSAVNQ